MQHTPVIIVGGSLVGLSASLFLSWRGVANVVVERHRGSSPHPRAMGFTEHTLEFYRAVGIADRIPQVAPGTLLRRTRAESLAGQWSDALPWTPGQAEAPAGDLSPCTGAAIAQDRLEPILRGAAAEFGSDLRQGMEMLRFHDTGAGVVVQLRERDSGETHWIRADYLIAADGADSAIREQLGIGRDGVGHLRTIRSVLFRCDEADAYLDRGFQQFEIAQPDLHGFLTTYGDGRWVLMFEDDRERSPGELAQAVRHALGKDMRFELITTGRWEMAGRIARRYSLGRVFLAGDAAHQLPPTRGGFGANTGIEDAWNLAWKLQLVLAGVSAPALLDTYAEERQPIGWLRHQQTFARPDYKRWVGTAQVDTHLYGNAAMELGQLVRSRSIVGAGPDLPPAAEPSQWRGQPGTRAPHLWLEAQGQRLSTVDVLNTGFALVTDDAAWAGPARRAAASLGLDLKTLVGGVNVRFPDGRRFGPAFGLAEGGAALVRPDGIVAWRSQTGGPSTEMLVDVLRQVACTRR